MKYSDYLKAAKALIDSPEKWTQGEYWRDAEGNSVDRPVDAACMCSMGALLATPGPAGPVACNYLMEACNDQCVVEFNDTHSHAEVMQMWDKAIELALKDNGERND